MNLRAVLTDAKKAAGAAVVGAGAAVTAGLIDNRQAAVITGAAGVVTAVVVYLLDNTGRASRKAPHVPEHAAGIVARDSSAAVLAHVIGQAKVQGASDFTATTDSAGHEWPEGPAPDVHGAY